MASPARTDAETLGILEKVRPVYERLRSERMRNEGVIQGCERDHKAAEERAMEMFGTSDEGEIRAIIEERRARNATRVDDFDAQVRQIQASLAEVDGRPA